jgi:hypothetical protein
VRSTRHIVGAAERRKQRAPHTVSKLDYVKRRGACASVLSIVLPRATDADKNDLFAGLRQLTRILTQTA